MEEQKDYLYARDSEQLQLSYSEYVELMEKEKEAERIQAVIQTVMADLKTLLAGGTPAADQAVEVPQQDTAPDLSSEAEAPQADKVAVEFSADDETAEPVPETPRDHETAADPEAEKPSAAKARGEMSEVPAIKNEIAEHFNRIDESGRLFNIFKQYYTCLNEMCGGTVRVTMKDGFCSLWNYDEWEEFAFVDIFEDQLRIAIDPRYTDELKSQHLCDVPRLLSSRRNIICVKVDGLNNTVLDVMAKAFAEVGLQVG